ncbi:hypothetical protein ABBQ32_010925 [Trebouxia sp. C0010 RCD-2024]
MQSWPHRQGGSLRSLKAAASVSAVVTFVSQPGSGFSPYWVRQSKDTREVKPCIRQNFQNLGSSLEQQPPEVLCPLLSTLLDDGHMEAAAMVIAALLVSTSDDIQLFMLCAELERTFRPQRALQTLANFF